MMATGAATILPLPGGCRCGQLRFRVTQAPLITAACHCTGCQRMSASAFSLTMIVPETGFELLSGEPVIGGVHGPETRHHHCAHCLSWVFTRLPPQMGIVNVRPTMLDDPTWFEPFIETFTAEKLPWARTPARRSFEGLPAAEEFGGLIAAYRASGIWPGAEPR